MKLKPFIVWLALGALVATVAAVLATAAGEGTPNREAKLQRAVDEPVAAPNRTPNREAKLQRALDELVAAGAPGAVALVREGSRTLRLTSGYAELGAKSRMRAGDRFRVGSTTKTFVATVVLQLVGEGKLSLEDTVERWLPSLVPNGRAITLRQLLNHTSGLFDYLEDPRVKGPILREDHTRVWAPRRLIEIATSHKPLFAPGARWSYSNTGYVLLGLTVEAASGHSLGRELRERIFRPLGLRATTLATRARIAGRHVHGYGLLGSRRLHDVSVLDPSWAWAAGAVASTVSDLARFYRALLGGRLLRRDLLRAMETTVPVTPQQRYGLGLFTMRWPCGVSWGHGGDTPGYWTQAQNTRDGRRQVVLTLNASDESLPKRAQKARDRFLFTAFCR